MAQPMSRGRLLFLLRGQGRGKCSIVTSEIFKHHNWMDTHDAHSRTPASSERKVPITAGRKAEERGGSHGQQEEESLSPRKSTKESSYLLE